MGRLERTMRRKAERAAKKAEKVAPNELSELKRLNTDLTTCQAKAQEAALQAAEAQTRRDFCVMELRHKYDLKVGDQINPDDGKITRA